MAKRLHIIYLPGFGDGYDIGRRTALWGWRIWGVTTQYIPMRWNSNESYSEKYARIDQAITAAAGRRIVIIGESASGTMALAAYAKRRRDLYKVMTISGKNNNPASVAPRLYRQHVAFREALATAEAATNQLSSEDHHDFIAFYPLYDEVIPPKEAVIPDCQLVRLFSAGHLLTIALALTLYSGYIVRIAKR